MREKKAISMSLKRPKCPVRANKRLNLTMFPCLQEQKTKINTTEHMILRNLHI